eukprot:scaffold12241_cov93-Skeletonema_marinoi.AAC.2
MVLRDLPSSPTNNNNNNCSSNGDSSALDGAKKLRCRNFLLHISLACKLAIVCLHSKPLLRVGEDIKVVSAPVSAFVAPMATFFLLFIFQLHTLTSFGVNSFTTKSSSSYQSATTPCYRRAAQRTLYFSNPVDDDNRNVVTSNNNDIDEKDDDTNGIDRPVSLLERARIISYRIAMSASALSLCVLAVDD